MARHSRFNSLRNFSDGRLHRADRHECSAECARSKSDGASSALTTPGSDWFRLRCVTFISLLFLPLSLSPLFSLPSLLSLPLSLSSLRSLCLSSSSLPLLSLFTAAYSNFTCKLRYSVLSCISGRIVRPLPHQVMLVPPRPAASPQPPPHPTPTARSTGRHNGLLILCAAL